MGMFWKPPETEQRLMAVITETEELITRNQNESIGIRIINGNILKKILPSPTSELN